MQTKIQSTCSNKSELITAACFASLSSNITSVFVIFDQRPVWAAGKVLMLHLALQLLSCKLLQLPTCTCTMALHCTVPGPVFYDFMNMHEHVMQHT